MRIKAILMYDGKNFCGFQIQPNKRTVQGEVEDALKVFFRKQIRIFASGRTDAGVSAMGQVIHFDIDSDKIDIKKMIDGVNAIMQSDVAITSAEIAGDDFDARFSVKKKTYRYYFYASKFVLPLYSWAARINDYADISAMERACKNFVGTFDFKSFVSRKSGKTDFVRTIFNAEIIRINDDLFAFEITGNGFLYNMVRIMFGTLTLAAYHKISPDDVTEIIEQKDRSHAGKTFPPNALVLQKVEY